MTDKQIESTYECLYCGNEVLLSEKVCPRCRLQPIPPFVEAMREAGKEPSDE